MICAEWGVSSSFRIDFIIESFSSDVDFVDKATLLSEPSDVAVEQFRRTLLELSKTSDE
jgi:hypothetical protein